jgi:hypothetical protein
MQDFVNKQDIKGNLFITNAFNFLIKKFKQSTKIFSYSSGLGQLLLVVNNLGKLIMLYVRDSLNQTNFYTATREEAIFGLSSLVGHQAKRGTSAFGTISLKIKNDLNLSLYGGTIYITNYLKLKNNFDESIPYIIDMPSDYFPVDLNLKNDYELSIKQGELIFEEFNGTGEDLQSFNIINGPNELIEDSFIRVTVNGKLYKNYTSIYDIPYKEHGCLIRNGITGGIVIIFGNELNHSIPKLGEKIVVDYLLTKGSQGNVLNENSLKWSFIDTGFDINNNEVNLNEIFDISTINKPDFGSDSEDKNLTKIIAPYVNFNQVLHDEKSIFYYFSKLNYFSVIKIFRESEFDLNNYNVMLIPKIENRFSNNEDFFDFDINKILLTKEEQKRILNMIMESDLKSANINITLINPLIRKVSLDIMISCYSIVNGKSVNQNFVKREIRRVLNEYQLKNNRVNKLPHSDIVRILDSLDFCDSVKVIIIPESEDYIDEYGDVNLNNDELVVIRGGFTDSNGVPYFDTFDSEDETQSSVNISITFNGLIK